MERSMWRSWLDVENTPELQVLVHGPLENTSNYHPSVLGNVSSRRLTPGNTPGIDVKENLQQQNPIITCSVALGLEICASGERSCKMRHHIIAEEQTVDDFLRRVMYSVCDVIYIQSSSADEAVEEFVAWLDSCISIQKTPTRPAVALKIGNERSTDPSVLSNFEMMCTMALERGGIHKSIVAVRDLMRECFSDVAIVHDGKPFSSQIERMLQIAVQHRVRAQCFYSTSTMVQLFEKACEHFTATSAAAFCFITTLRREVLPNIPSASDGYLIEYFRTCSVQRTLTEFVYPAIAHSLVQDASRITCHCKKAPKFIRASKLIIDRLWCFSNLLCFILRRLQSSSPHGM
jgi:hypothetical protein